MPTFKQGHRTFLWFEKSYNLEEFNSLFIKKINQDSVVALTKFLYAVLVFSSGLNLT